MKHMYAVYYNNEFQHYVDVNYMWAENELRSMCNVLGNLVSMNVDESARELRFTWVTDDMRYQAELWRIAIRKEDTKHV